MRALVVLFALAVIGCHPAAPARPRAPLADAPYELADDLDFAERADALWALPPGDARAALRRDLAEVLGARLDRALAARRLDRAGSLTTALAGLWQTEPAALTELAEAPGWAARLDRARSGFARGGADREAALVLVLRLGSGLGPAERDRAELDQIIAFADDLGVARLGALGLGTGAIGVLTPIVERGLAPDLVARYVELVLGRANQVDQAIGGGAATPAAAPAVRAAMGASRDLAIALATAHQIERLAPALVGLQGLGRERRLDQLARAAAAPEADARAWAALAGAIRASDGGDDDAKLRAALTVCLDGLVRFPDDATLTAAAAVYAMEAERVAQPIALLERARRADPDDVELADRLLQLYRERLGRLIYGGRGHAAAACLAELRQLYRELARRHRAHTWSVSWAQVLATYGRGLISQGELAAGQRALTSSVRAQPTLEALEMLGTVALKTGVASAARGYYEQAVALPGDRPAEQYARAKLLRLAGDAAAAAGDADAARGHYAEALSLWADLGQRLELPPNLAGERLVESGKLFWALDKPDDGAELMTSASAVDPDGADTHIQAVAFLLLHGQYDRARDTFYQALASERIGDYYKVYIALWILAEGRRLGRADDDQAQAYLAGRDGPLWYDEIARLATGRRSVGDLTARAATRARQTELAYYAAVLDPARPDASALLEDVVASELVLFFEYDMARHRLGRGP
ncbi:MAG: hypothetical protein IPL61_11200 [Myxococcales bacterium]|nr:hypothetical protein [Myxococcales bacterium]